MLLFLAIIGIGHETQRGARRCKRRCLAPGKVERRHLSRIRVTQGARPGIEEAGEQGNEHARSRAEESRQAAIEPFHEARHRSLHALRSDVLHDDDRLEDAGHEGSRDTMSGDVTDQEECSPLGQLQDVVVVSAAIQGGQGTIVEIDAQSLRRRDFYRQEEALHLSCPPQLHVQAPLVVGVLLADAIDLEGLFDLRAKVIPIPGLQDVAEDARLDCLHHFFHFGITAQQDRDDLRVALLDGNQQVASFHCRHAQVGHHELVFARVRVQHPHDGKWIRRDVDLHARGFRPVAELPPQGQERIRLVIHEQHSSTHRGPFFSPVARGPGDGAGRMRFIVDKNDDRPEHGAPCAPSV